MSCPSLPAPCGSASTLPAGDPDSSSLDPSISANGRYVAFHSLASDLVVPEDANGLSFPLAEMAQERA